MVERKISKDFFQNIVQRQYERDQIQGFTIHLTRFHQIRERLEHE